MKLVEGSKIMKKILMLFLCVFIVASCTKFEITNEIKPKIYVIGDSVGVEYILGDILVADELEDLSHKMLQYFEENKDNITMRLHIYYNTEVSMTTYFTYYIGGIKIAENENVVSGDLLIAKKDLIDGFVVLNGHVSDKETSKKEIPKKIEKIQKESTPVKRSGDRKL